MNYMYSTTKETETLTNMNYNFNAVVLTLLLLVAMGVRLSIKVPKIDSMINIIFCYGTGWDKVQEMLDIRIRIYAPVFSDKYYHNFALSVLYPAGESNYLVTYYQICCEQGQCAVGVLGRHVPMFLVNYGHLLKVYGYLISERVRLL